MINPLMHMRDLINSQERLTPSELEEFAIILKSLTLDELKSIIALVRSASYKIAPMAAIAAARAELEKSPDRPDKPEQAAEIKS